MAQSKKVLITGVTGYVGSWCAHAALEAGYTVVGTVRSAAASKCGFLHDAIAGKAGSKMSSRAATHLSLVEADLLDGTDKWDSLMRGSDIDYVMHTASPYFSREPADEDEYIRPAREGTISVVRAAVANGVRRVVFTSTVGTMWEPLEPRMYTPADWSDPAIQAAYGKSKTLAERAAWAEVEGLPTQLCTVHPMFISGPTLYTDASPIRGFESGTLVTNILGGKVPAVPKTWMGVSDVRDVANVHVAALEHPAAAGERFITSHPTRPLAEIVGLFVSARPELGIAARELPSLLVRVLGFLRLQPFARLAKTVGVRYDVDASRTKSLLGLEFVDQATTAAEMADDLIALGVLGEQPPLPQVESKPPATEAAA